MFKRIFRFLGGVGKVAGRAAPEIIGLVNPALGGILEGIISSTIDAEARHGSGEGDKKLGQVMAGIGTALPVVIRLMEAQMGQDCVDEEAFVKAYRDLVNGIVGMMNAFRVFPKKA